MASSSSSKAQEPELLDHKGGLPTVAFAINSSSKRNLCLVPCDSPEFYVFAENVAFSSPTAGAVIVNAGNVSGRIGSWRVEGTSKTYQDWHEEKLAKAGAAPADAE